MTGCRNFPKLFFPLPFLENVQKKKLKSDGFIEKFKFLHDKKRESICRKEFMTISIGMIFEWHVEQD